MTRIITITDGSDNSADPINGEVVEVFLRFAIEVCDGLLPRIVAFFIVTEVVTADPEPDDCQIVK